MTKNVEDWDLDGVDVYTHGYFIDDYESNSNNAGFHYQLFKNLRSLLPSDKTISYTVSSPPTEQNVIGTEWSCGWHPMEPVIAAAHRFLDYINISLYSEQEEFILNFLTELGVPASKIGINIGLRIENLIYTTNLIKERGLRGVSLYTANQENSLYRGDYSKKVAELLYM